MPSQCHCRSRKQSILTTAAEDWWKVPSAIRHLSTDTSNKQLRPRFSKQFFNLIDTNRMIDGQSTRFLSSILSGRKAAIRPLPLMYCFVVWWLLLSNSSQLTLLKGKRYMQSRTIYNNIFFSKHTFVAITQAVSFTCSQHRF